MSPIKDFKLIYEAVNQEGTFSAGDTVVGTASFKLTDETKVKSIVVKVKGEARVHWTEGTGDNRRSHSDHRNYFKEKVYLVEKHGKSRPRNLLNLLARLVTRTGCAVLHDVKGRHAVLYDLFAVHLIDIIKDHI